MGDKNAATHRHTQVVIKLPLQMNRAVYPQIARHHVRDIYTELKRNKNKKTWNLFKASAGASKHVALMRIPVASKARTDRWSPQMYAVVGRH